MENQESHLTRINQPKNVRHSPQAEKKRECPVFWYFPWTLAAKDFAILPTQTC